MGEAGTKTGGGSLEEVGMEVEEDLEVLTAAANVLDSLSAIGVAIVEGHADKLRNVRRRLKGSKRVFIEREAELKDRVKVLEAECQAKEENLEELGKENERKNEEVVDLQRVKEEGLRLEEENAQLKAEMKRKEETAELWRGKYELAMKMVDFWQKKAKDVAPKEVAEVAVQTKPGLTFTVPVPLVAPMIPEIPETPREDEGGNARDKNGEGQVQLKDPPAPAVKKRGRGRPSTEKLREDLQPPSEKRVHQCLFCNMSFNRLAHFENHTRVHTGERPYFCQLCDKGFTERSNLTSHAWTHEKDKEKEVTPLPRRRRK